MLLQLASLHKLGRENFVLGLRLFEDTSGVAHAITQEISDYGRRTVQQSAATCEKLVESKTIEATLDLQSDHAKSALDDFFTHSKKMGALYQTLAKEAAKSLTAAGVKQTIEEAQKEAAKPLTTGEANPIIEEAQKPVVSQARPSDAKPVLTVVSRQPETVVERNAIKEAVAAAVKEAAQVRHAASE
jgi:hypothetical protein